MSGSTPTRLAVPTVATARLSLGSVGPVISVGEHLRFQLDHALARDAVHAALDTGLLQRGLRERQLTPLLLHSAAADRKIYLRRPDLGRALHADSIAALEAAVNPGAACLTSETWDPQTPAQARIAILLADGLSALALERHALPLLDAMLPLILTPTPVVPILTNARVALGDPVGEMVNADLTLLLIGERPGLSSPDSLGCYITWRPRAGSTTDAQRNCISNIRTEGLGYAEAAARIAHYVAKAGRLQATGTMLKDPPTIMSLHTAI